jgi:hypothetical protein
MLVNGATPDVCDEPRIFPTLLCGITTPNLATFLMVMNPFPNLLRTKCTNKNLHGCYGTHVMNAMSYYIT